MSKKYTSTKVYDGFSTCFRQWRATDTHCSRLHGYGVSFKVWFEGELDHRNWVADFGIMKRAIHKIDGKSPMDFFKWLLDHTVIMSEDDPALPTFRELDKQGVLQLRVVPDVGCERFAEFLLLKVNEFIQKETGGRVKAIQLEFFEHNKNSAIAKLE